MKRFFGKIPEPLRRFARGQDRVEAPLDRASPDEGDARALIDSAKKYERVLPPLQQLMQRPKRPNNGKDW